MHRIIVTTNNKRNINFIKSLLKKFDFIKFETEEISSFISTPDKKADLSDLFGIWKDRDIDLRKIREKAWTKRN